MVMVVVVAALLLLLLVLLLLRRRRRWSVLRHCYNLDQAVSRPGRYQSFLSTRAVIFDYCMSELYSRLRTGECPKMVEVVALLHIDML